MKRLIAAALFCAVVCAAHAQDKTITGKWTVQISVEGNDREFVCDVKQEGKDLKGMCDTQGELVGSVTGDTYTWNTAGGQAALTFRGMLKDGKLVGTVDVPEYSMKGSFQGTPVK
jgi:hypothetical protein